MMAAVKSFWLASNSGVLAQSRIQRRPITSSCAVAVNAAAVRSNPASALS